MPVTFRDLLHGGGVLPFAHRGAGLVAPENTMAAFQAAVDLGFLALETDVQISKDGVLFVHHDNSLKRLTGEDRRFETLTSGEIDQLRIRGGHAIPRLADVFEAFPDAVFNLDAKSWAATDGMAALIRSHGIAQRVCIGAFSDGRIRRVMSQLDRGALQSIGTARTIRFALGVVSGIGQRLGADCVQLPVARYGVTLVTAKSIAYAHRLGLKVHVWTVNDGDEMHRLIDLGVDGLMSDDCALLKSVLISRGCWPHCT